MKFSWRAIPLILLLTIISLSLSAQSVDDPHPTLSALQEAVIPPRDRVVLARELSGVTEIQPPLTEPIDYQLGALESFTVSNSTDDEITRIEAELAAIGQHILIWVDARADYDPAEIQALAEAFDTFIYPKSHALWGSENNPGIDGDSRVFAVFAYGVGDGVGAYVSSDHTYPSEVVSTSNEHEMFIYNLAAYEPNLDSLGVQSTTAHEFQHMIRENINRNPETWVNEGLSVFSEIYMGYPDADSITGIYLTMPFTQLNTWADEAPRAPHYGAAGLFFTYLYERYGHPAIDAVSQADGDGLTAVDNALKSLGHSGVEEFFADWVAANVAVKPQTEDGRWGYELVQQGRAFQRVVNEYPYTFDSYIFPYAADYFAIGLLDSDVLRVTLEIPNTNRVIPTEAYSGQQMWYSHRADGSATTLTRQFDLTGVSSAELTYKTWYRFEEGWDYGYVMVSTNGQTWDILSTKHTTDVNPHNTAYGTGYTGRSGDWLEERLSLDAYVGQPIWVRFASITDDAVTQPGMAIDDVRLDAVGYASDFETDDGGWISEGWVRMDNQLPQKTYVQVVQLLPNDEVRVTRHLLTESTGTWDFMLDPARERVFLAISPVVPFTTESSDYTLTVEQG